MTALRARRADWGNIPLEDITAKHIAEQINTLALKGDAVLCNEVQYRYFMRPDIRMLSLDGITDGKVGNGTLDDMIVRERPRFYIHRMARPHWVVNHPLFRESMLSRIPEDTVTVKGIRFTPRGDFYILDYAF